MFFGNECAADATRFSPSVAPVIAVSGIAVRSVGSLPGVNNAGAPIVAINVVLKVDYIDSDDWRAGEIGRAHV